MGTLLSGSCLCGFVRYQCAGEPEDATYCHCDACRKATGGPYTVGVVVKAALLRIVSGRVKGYTTKADSGNQLTREFCPECGSPLFTRHKNDPNRVWLKAGCLDQPERVKPSCQTWTDSAVPWSTIDTGLPSYPRGRPIKPELPAEQ